MNELPSSSGAKGGISTSTDSDPKSDDIVPQGDIVPQEEKGRDRQGKAVNTVSGIEPQPLNKSGSPSAGLPENISIATEGASQTPDVDVKSKNKLMVFFGQSDPLPDQQVLDLVCTMDFPEMGKHRDSFDVVLKKLDDKLLAPDSTRQDKAHCMFHKAVCLKRMGKGNDVVERNLKLALKLDSMIVSQQLKTAVALLNISQHRDSKECVLESLPQISKARNFTQPSVMAHLNKLQRIIGLIDSELLSVFRNPSLMSLYLAPLTNLMSDTDLMSHTSPPLPEATFCNGLELSFVLGDAVYCFDDLSDDELGGANLIWTVVNIDKNKERRLEPKSFSRNLPSERLVLLIPILMAQNSRTKEIVRERLGVSGWQGIQLALKKLSEVELEPPVTFGKATVAMFLGLSAEMGVLSISSEACANYFHIAAQHELFSEMLLKASDHYQRATLYEQAMAELNRYCEAPYIPTRKRQDIDEMMEECEIEFAQHEKILERAAALSNTDTASSSEGKSSAEASPEVRRQKTSRKPGKGKKGGKGPKGAKSPQQSHRHKLKTTVTPEQKHQHEAALQPQSESKKDDTSVNEISGSEWSKDVSVKMSEYFEARKTANIEIENQSIEACIPLVQTSVERYHVNYSTAWHYLNQTKRIQKRRMAMPDGSPATVEYVCNKGRVHLARCFKSLTGISIEGTDHPDKVRACLQVFKVPDNLSRDEVTLLRRRLRMVMSSFGHSYSFQADLEGADPKYRFFSEEFYKLKKIVNPLYSKNDAPKQAQYQGVQVVDEETFKFRRSGYD